jgi:tetratricopeptide (TPR) repeat protein
MIEKIRTISNPLTIIAIFSALAEVAGTVTVSLISPEVQGTFIWFVMLFPVTIVAMFFLTLNFNPKVLYAPSDFKDEENFLSSLRGENLTKSTFKAIEKKLESTKYELEKQFLAHSKSLDDETKSSIRDTIDKKLSELNLEIKEQEEELNFNLGIQLGASGKHAEAIAAYLKAIENNDPNPSLCFLNIGNRYQAMGYLDLALTAWEKSIELNPKQCLAYLRAGEQYRTLGKLEKAYSRLKFYVDFIAENNIQPGSKFYIDEALKSAREFVSEYKPSIRASNKRSS